MMKTEDHTQGLISKEDTPHMTQAMIETKQLTKCYHAKPVVDHLDISVPEGAIYGFLGPNGA